MILLVQATDGEGRALVLVNGPRVPAFGSDSDTYTFTAPANGGATIEVTLLYRRAFIDLMDWKGWDVPDIVMEAERIEIP